MNETPRLCSVEDCTNEKCRANRLCSIHLAEKRRTAYQADKDKQREYNRRWRERHEGHLYERPDTGYVQYFGYKHPVCNPSGAVGYHRIVLWNALEGKDANCHWCDKPVTWSKTYPKDQDGLVADHLNFKRNDNRPENLVPSCGRCNVSRTEAAA